MNEDDIRLALAEKILDEMIQAERKGQEDYELFVKHFDKDTLNDFGPTRFKKGVLDFLCQSLYSIQRGLNHVREI